MTEKLSDLSTAKGEGVPQNGTKMRDVTDEEELDELVQKASVPNLASLYRKGKDKGLLKPQQEYGHTT